jgi:hypothetical protein
MGEHLRDRQVDERHGLGVDHDRPRPGAGLRPDVPAHFVRVGEEETALDPENDDALLALVSGCRSRSAYWSGAPGTRPEDQRPDPCLNAVGRHSNEA